MRRMVLFLANAALILQFPVLHPLPVIRRGRRPVGAAGTNAAGSGGCRLGYWILNWRTLRTKKETLR